MDDARLMRLLTYSGALPFAALTLCVILGWPAGDAARQAIVDALTGYGAVIASFMAGIFWGLRLSRDDLPLRVDLLFVSNALALAAWAGLLIPVPRLSLVLLALVFVGLYAVDGRLAAAGIHPAWYGQLRARITAIVVGLLVVAALFV